MESLVTVIAFERPNTLMKQHVTFKSDLFSEPLSTLVYRTRVFKGQVFGSVRLFLVLHQVLDHLETTTALVAPTTKETILNEAQ